MRAAYATKAELVTYLGSSVDTPEDADRLLQEASALIDYWQEPSGITFSIDTVTELPTDTDVAEAMRDAACAQVRFWVETGEEHDIDGLAGTDVSVGSYSGVRPPELAPRTKRFLMLAGLL